MVRWTQASLSNRLFWMTFDGVRSRTVTLKQGVPQRSVQSPILFLTIGLHASIVGSKMKQQAGTLRYLALTDWGYDKSILRSIYIASGRSTVEYAAAAWLPLVSISTMVMLDTCQRYSGRAITGQIMTTPVEAILAEADLPTVATRATQLSTIAMEKSLRMPDANPGKQIASAEIRQRSKKTSWRKIASEVWRSIFGFTQAEWTPRILPPWIQTGSHFVEGDGVKSGEAEKDKIWA